MSLRRITILGVALVLVLSACSGDRHGDLRQFVKDSENMPRGRIPTLPEVKPYEPFTYSAFDLVDPFKPRKIVPPKGGGGSAPDLNRRREALEAYPLESLRMVGTLEQKKQMFALVKAPDNTLFRVRAGNYVGQNFGRVISISESTITLKELLQDISGNWEEKDQILQLQEESEGRK